jgi:hypothetical protein
MRAHRCSESAGPQARAHALGRIVARGRFAGERTVLVVDDLHLETKPPLLMPLHALGAGATFSDDARVLVVASARRRVGAVRLPPRPAISGRATL